jgi:hypothetical protein
MAVVRLIHWNEAEGRKRAAHLTDMGHKVVFDLLQTPAMLRGICEHPPDVFAIDLSRLPSQGRDLGIVLRQTRATRYLPIVFMDGDPEKVARIRSVLPDAVYTSWELAGKALKAALAKPPADPIVPKSRMEGYSGTPLARKLGIKPNSKLVLIGAPPRILETLGDLPAGVEIRQDARGPCDLVVWFARSMNELLRAVSTTAARQPATPFWLAWPKRASGMKTDLSQQVVREAGLSAGLVDYKICAIDDTWSGLLFTKRTKESEAGRRKKNE